MRAGRAPLRWRRDSAVITVVVPTRDRPEALARCLAALERQTAPALEIVVVDDGRGAVAPGVRIVRAGAGGPAAARNAGARAARGDVICFTDDDCTPAPDWAQQLAELCAGGGAAAGATIADPAAGPAAAASQLLTNTLMLASRDERSGGLRFAPTCNLACAAETLRALPFDESFALAAGEDRDWCARLVAGGGCCATRRPPRSCIDRRSACAASSASSCDTAAARSPSARPAARLPAPASTAVSRARRAAPGRRSPSSSRSRRCRWRRGRR